MSVFPSITKHCAPSDPLSLLVRNLFRYQKTCSFRNTRVCMCALIAKVVFLHFHLASNAAAAAAAATVFIIFLHYAKDKLCKRPAAAPFACSFLLLNTLLPNLPGAPGHLTARHAAYSPAAMANARLVHASKCYLYLLWNFKCISKAILLILVYFYCALRVRTSAYCAWVNARVELACGWANKVAFRMDFNS